VSGVVVWLTGKPSSGKSTLALRLCERLHERGTANCILDGDELRAALVPRHGYDPKSRDEYYATLGNLAAVLARQGLVVVVPATAHLKAFRERARARAPAFVEVYVEATQEEVEGRDVKGLYLAVREGRAGGVPGADLGYEVPEQPDVVACGGHDDAAVERITAMIAGMPEKSD
jgi:adenylylsulfate kinase